MNIEKIELMNRSFYISLEEAIIEARRFIERAEVAQCILEDNQYAWAGTKETGAAKRASMDLTRALVFVRNPNK